jgi:hypothetical protein
VFNTTPRLVGPQGRSGRMRKISPTNGIRSPDRPAPGESLYRLINWWIQLKQIVFVCANDFGTQAVYDNYPKVLFGGIPTLSVASSNVCSVNCRRTAVFVNDACTVNITQRRLGVRHIAICLHASLETAHNYWATKRMDAQKLF